MLVTQICQHGRIQQVGRLDLQLESSAGSSVDPFLTGRRMGIYASSGKYILRLLCVLGDTLLTLVVYFL
jgi:hypothetical protein